MSILDKLKPQPRWKHSDSAVRLQAIAELDDPEELATLAERDLDARVRQAAIAKVGDPAVLGRVIAVDADLGVRDAAADRLLALALDAPPAAAVAAASFLADVRRLSTVAKSAAADAVREAALAKLSDERALGSVARHAKMESTAQAAAARLSSSDELLSTVLNSDHREVALAAFDRVVHAGSAADPDVALLETIAARAQQKVVARRAKAMLQAIADAEDARRAAAAVRERQEALLCAAVEGLAQATDPDRAGAELARLTAAWETLGDTDAAVARRFAAAADAARARISQRSQELEIARAATRRRDEALASRDVLCRRVETIAGSDFRGQLASLEAEWAALPPLVEYEDEVAALTARFAAAAAACRERCERAAALGAARDTLDGMVVEAEALAAEMGSAAAARWRVLSRDARALVSTLGDASRPVADLVDRLEAVARVFAAHETAAREAAAKARQERMQALARLAARAERTAAAETITLREGERLLRDLAEALKGVDAETMKEAREVVATLRSVQGRLALRVKELREMDDWRRFANVQQQEELIAMAEAIVASLEAEKEAGVESDLAATANALRELHQRWHEAAAVPQHVGRRLWDRFRAATDFIRSRCEVYFAQLREERRSNLAARTALVEEAEMLAGSTDWTKTGVRFQELQKAWDDAGPVGREAGRELARRFRAACRAFYAGRRGALSSLKKEWEENLARKEALCERAEHLSASTDWDATASELKKLQADWKTIGPVSHKKREAIWNRFRSAADTFFVRYHDRHKLAAVARVAEHAELVTTLEALGALAEAPEDLAAQVQALRAALASLPRVESAEMEALRERWRAALAAIGARWPAAFTGTDLDSAAVQARLEKLVAKIERLLAGAEPATVADGSDAASLADRLRAALASNAMGIRPDESKWRAARKTVEDAREAWRRIALVSSSETRALETRFEAACAGVMEQVQRHGGPREAFGEERRGRGRPPGRRSNRGPGSGAPREAGRPMHAKPRPRS